MTRVEFLTRWFPLVVRCDGEEYPIEWFENERGVARISGKFVVSVYPSGGSLQGPLTYKSTELEGTVAWTWDGLYAEVIEHGVGSIDKAVFLFDDFLKSRSRFGMNTPLTYTKAGNLPLGELYKGMAVLRRNHYLPEDLPRCFWHLYEPTDPTELLAPMARYIEKWL